MKMKTTSVTTITESRAIGRRRQRRYSETDATVYGLRRKWPAAFDAACFFINCRGTGLRTSLKGVIWPLASLLAVNSVPTAMAGELDGDFRIWNEYKLTEYSRDRWTTFTCAEARFVDDASQVGLWLL